MILNGINDHFWDQRDLVPNFLRRCARSTLIPCPRRGDRFIAG